MCRRLVDCCSRRVATRQPPPGTSPQQLYYHCHEARRTPWNPGRGAGLLGGRRLFEQAMGNKGSRAPGQEEPAVVPAGSGWTSEEYAVEQIVSSLATGIIRQPESSEPATVMRMRVEAEALVFLREDRSPLVAFPYYAIMCWGESRAVGARSGAPGCRTVSAVLSGCFLALDAPAPRAPAPHRAATCFWPLLLHATQGMGAGASSSGCSSTRCLLAPAPRTRSRPLQLHAVQPAQITSQAPPGRVPAPESRRRTPRGLRPAIRQRPARSRAARRRRLPRHRTVGTSLRAPRRRGS